MATLMDSWNKFMNSPSSECLDLFESEYRRTGDLPTLRNHNKVLMDVGEWKQARGNYLKIIEEDEYSHDCDFIMLGQTEWFLHNTSAAVDFWRKSINTQYAACPGAPDTPLLLWYAGQRLADNKLIKESLKKLQRYWRVPDYRMFRGWMGTAAIAGLLMNKVPADVFLHEWKDKEEGPLEDRRSCRANFWVGMMCLKEGDETTSAAYFKSAFSGAKIAILQYEYFLAKWEYAKLTGQNVWENKTNL